MFNPYKEVEKKLTEAVDALKAASVEALTVDASEAHDQFIQLQFATSCQLRCFQLKYKDELNCPIQNLK